MSIPAAANPAAPATVSSGRGPMLDCCLDMRNDCGTSGLGPGFEVQDYRPRLFFGVLWFVLMFAAVFILIALLPVPPPYHRASIYFVWAIVGVAMVAVCLVTLSLHYAFEMPVGMDYRSLYFSPYGLGRVPGWLVARRAFVLISLAPTAAFAVLGLPAAYGAWRYGQEVGVLIFTWMLLWLGYTLRYTLWAASKPYGTLFEELKEPGVVRAHVQTTAAAAAYRPPAGARVFRTPWAEDEPPANPASSASPAPSGAAGYWIRWSRASWAGTASMMIFGLSAIALDWLLSTSLARIAALEWTIFGASLVAVVVAVAVISLPYGLGWWSLAASLGSLAAGFLLSHLVVGRIFGLYEAFRTPGENPEIWVGLVLSAGGITALSHLANRSLLGFLVSLAVTAAAVWATLLAPICGVFALAAVPAAAALANPPEEHGLVFPVEE